MVLRMDDNQLFWTFKSKWPADYTGKHVFLAEAVMKVGKHLFPDEWTGEEPATPVERYNVWIDHETHPGPILEAQASPWQRDAVRRLLERASPTGKIELVPGGKYSPATFRFGQSEWRRGCEIAREADKARTLAFTRYRHVQAFLRDHLARGELHCVVRGIEGGSFSDALSPDLWNTEAIGRRFLRCQMNVNDPFGASFAGLGFAWIFLTKEHLEGVLSEDGDDDPAAESNKRVQRVIHLAVQSLYDGKRPAIHVAVRDEEIQKWALKHKYHPPGTRSIRRYFSALASGGQAKD